MDVRNMFVICGISYMKNPEDSCPTRMFIDSQGFIGIGDFTMRCIKDVPHMIKDNKLVPNQ